MESCLMTKRQSYTTGILLIGMLLLPGLELGARQTIVTTFGAFTESQLNNEPYASGNLFLVPGMSVSLRGLDIPIFGKIQFENRMKPGTLAGNTYLDTELRHRYHFGGILELIPGYTFTPEYEARIKNYAGYDFHDKSIWENRFHMNFSLHLAPAWKLVIMAMPTWVLEHDSTDPRGGGVSAYSDFYSEASLGPSWTISSRDALSLMLYEESKIYQQFETSPGTLNNGLAFRMLEFQVRIIWSHQFQSGISINPFARIGIIRNVYTQTGGTVDVSDERRNRFGFTLRGDASEGGTSLYMESYYQRQEQNGSTPVHRFMFKLGCDYRL